MLMRSEETEPRRFLMLQGPHGRFFALLAAALRERAATVERINLCGGDRADWIGPATDFRGRRSDWPDFLDRFLQDHDTTDLVLFGDCRDAHRSAHRLAKVRGLTIHVFEEGYIRPDWVTLEADGVNGHSRLSRDPDWYYRQSAHLPPVGERGPVPSDFSRRAWEAFAYHKNSILGRARFPHSQNHRLYNPCLEGLSWVRQWWRRSAAQQRTAELMERLPNRRHFLLPLQLDSDYQIRVHSPFGAMTVALSYVAESFAQFAPDDTTLVVKAHPLDNGLVPWARLIEELRARFGLGDRLAFMEKGDIALVTRGAAGVVTVNSTSGTLALHEGVPVKVLGQAVYNVAGVTDEQPLDSFWLNPRAPDATLWDAFCRVLVDRCLIRGGFQSDEGLTSLLDGAIDRLMGVPAPAEGA